MNIDIWLYDRQTGEARTYHDPYDWKQATDDEIEFMFSDGNYGCDCNRWLFFERARGVEPDDVECGDSRFRVRITERGTDRVIYSE